LVSFQDEVFIAFQEMKFLLKNLGIGEALCCPDELVGPLVIAKRYHNSKGFHQVGHVRHMI
jgi:hypothetical protein